MKASFLGKLLQRVERLEPDEIQRYLVRLAEQKGFLETIFNTLQEAIVVLDRQARIEYWNRGACRLLSIPEEGAAKVPLARYLRGVPWEELLREQSVTRKLEVDYPERRTLRFYLLPARGEGVGGWGDVYVAIFQDVTAEESAARQNLELERFEALRLLAAGVAHELGNPMNSLDIHLQLMRRELKKLPEKQTAGLRESVEVALREIERLDAIVRQFLQAVRPTLPQLEAGRLEEVVAEALALMGPELKDRDILVERDWKGPSPEVLMDRDQMKQVVFNLIKNSMQAIRGAGLLRLGVKESDGWVELEVTDNGKGIARDDLPHVLEPYFTTKKEGGGLGLMIVQRIVRDHGGELELESEEGRGTTVRVKLPRQQRRVHLLEN
ncbi:MAG: ATP-binding protein [Verrucomicrobiia bacterium]